MRVLAAGSLRGVWAQLITHFSEPVETHFGPAGILQERILAGEECDLFASANLAHPQALLAAGRAQAVVPFSSNKLCLTVRSDVMLVGDDWRALLNRTDLRLATSTAGCVLLVTIRRNCLTGWAWKDMPRDNVRWRWSAGAIPLSFQQARWRLSG